MHLMIVVVAAIFAFGPGSAVEQARAGRLELVAGRTGGASARPDEAQITSPFGGAFDDRETLYFVELLGHRVRKIGRDGLVTTLAGPGREGSGGDDRLAVQAAFNDPHHPAVTQNGAIYVA